MTVNGTIVIPRGASTTLQAVKVEQSGTMKGSDKITLKMHSFMFGGMVYEVSTTYVESKGKGEGKKTTRKVAGGAGLGSIVGGISNFAPIPSAFCTAARISSTAVKSCTKFGACGGAGQMPP